MAGATILVAALFSPSVARMMDPDLLGCLLDRHLAALVLYARQWCHAPEDVVQEVFLKLARQQRVPTHPVAWLYRSVRNRAVSMARSEERRRHHENQAAATAAKWFLPTEDPTGLDARSAGAALAGLPLEEREIIVAHLWGGLTFEQIAELAGVSPATCWRRYQAGLARLRTRLGDQCPTSKSDACRPLS